jgi:L-tryptophan--pyruvate aminotransferase
LSNDWSPKTIFDVCYNWPQYLIDRDGRSHSFTIKQDIMIFSLAKATGHAGTRIGWALVRDTQIARYMEDYIEYTTGGVSVEAQHKCLSLLNHQNNLFRLGANHYTCFGVGKSILQSRWNDLYNAWKTNKYTILNKYGMFVWCRGANNCNAATFERATQTSVISGKICGSDNRYFRINIGCSEKNFEEFINRVNKIK